MHFSYLYRYYQSHNGYASSVPYPQELPRMNTKVHVNTVYRMDHVGIGELLTTYDENGKKIQIINEAELTQLLNAARSIAVKASGTPSEKVTYYS